MFYTYDQNNSGGKFIQDDKVGMYVIIEADSSTEADSKAEEIGIYFDGVDYGRDCSCCGDRWSRTSDDSDERAEAPSIFSQTIEDHYNNIDFRPLRDEHVIHIYYKDGNHEKLEINALEKYEQCQELKRKQTDKLWGSYFNLLTDGVFLEKS